MELVVVRDSANVGCIAADTVLIEVRHMPNYMPLQDTVVCPNESAAFTIPYPWYNVLWNGELDAPSVDLSNGEHTVAIEFNGCTLNDTVLVIEEVFPEVDLPALHEACAPDGLLLELPVSVWWSDGSYSPVWLTYESAQVNWYYEQNECVFYDTTQVIIHPEPLWLWGADTVSCDGTTLTLDPQWPGDWNIPGAQNILQTNQAGDYVFTAESGSCAYYFPISIEHRETPNLPENTLIDLCAGTSTTIGVDPSPYDSYYWQNDTMGSWLEINEAGNYQLTANNFCGVDSMRFEVLELVCSSDLFIPNAFTPNEDAINEAWQPLGHDITRYHLIIYDALGNAIFETRDWSKAWTPGTGRIDLPYTYRIVYYDYQGVEHLKVGHINVLR
jgi:gliding motility-associated-like protein